MFSHMDFWTTFKIGVTMKSVRKIIKEMVEKYPNDMELGARVRILGGCMEKKKKIQRIASGVFKCISTNVKQEFMNQIV